ncbi:MAG: Mobile element protein [Olavius algarvensis Gamma 1 endosymbiont]|nr:MAG: Mobile element protein [Olavius algarvensis Gamma 1 endosymbiont]
MVHRHHLSIPMATGFMYLAAIIDWYSRYVIAWELSNIFDR